MTEGEALIATDEFHALFRQEAERLSGFVQSLKSEQLQPLIIAFRDKKATSGKREGLLIALGSFPDGDAKRKILFGTGMEAGRKKIAIVAAFLAAEAWMKTMTPAEGWRAKQKGVPQPSRCPDRQEVLVLWGRTIDGRATIGMAPLERHVGKVSLGEWKFADKDDRVQDNLLVHFFSGYLLGWKGDDKKDAGT